MSDLITVAIADDHKLLRKGLVEVIEKTGDIKVLLDVDDGEQLLARLGQLDILPNVVVLDVCMPVMNGIEVAAFVRSKYPKIKILALSMVDDDLDIIRMVRNGAVGYILKGEDPESLFDAIRDAHNYGLTRSSAMSKALISNVNIENQGIELNERLHRFCELAFSDMTYKEIADKMHVSPRTVDGYRDELFDRFSVKSRVGLVLHCLNNGIMRLDSFNS